MIRLHLWLRWRLAMRWLYEATHKPVDLGDQDPDVLFFRGLVAELRAENALLASDPNLERKHGELYRRTWAGLIKVGA